MENTNRAQLIRLSDKKSFVLSERLTTIGSSRRSKIRIDNEKVPQHCAYILFSSGNYCVHPVDTSIQVICNGKSIREPVELTVSSILEIGKESFLFEPANHYNEIRSDNSSFHKLVLAINAFFRNVDPESRFELLNGISQTLKCDGARLVIEDQTTGSFTTIAKFPQTSGRDRFSERALRWAKQRKKTILMNADEWLDEKRRGSLELNNVGTIICMPIICNETIHGYLYLDRFNTEAPFDNEDWEICNALAPVFGDILALYERTQQQLKTIADLQSNCTGTAGSVIFSCDKMRKAIETACRFAKTDSTILLQGETGTGKEVFAHFIHDNSNRSGKPFLVINCGAIPENLIESELFGHEKGAFTGATSRKAGLFESAQDGTVFLDEIGELPVNLQVKLLRVLQESEVLPLGATAAIKVNTRVIAATNRNLQDETESGNFRKDLYYRLNVLKIELPPLRERGNDIVLLAGFFINKYSARFGFSSKQITLKGQARLLKHSWPGNIRELENVIQKSILVSRGTMIEEHDLEIDPPDQRVVKQDGEPVVSLKEARERAEKSAIIHALEYSNGNVTVAANLLDTDRKWLTKLIKEYGIS